MEKKENIFSKIINFIKRIFENKKTKQLPTKTEEYIKQESKANFLDELRLDKKEDPILLKLQDQYEKSEMNLNDMSNEQIHDLNSLYKRQVLELKKKLDDKKTELSIIQRRIKNYSENM